MTKSPAAPLVIPGMSRKGEAVPAKQEAPVAPATMPTATSTSTSTEAPTGRLSSRIQPTIAVTVRLGEARYERMKSWGSSRRVTNQDVIVAALDRFFQLPEHERERAIENARK
jgi:hypothetical protein